MLRGLGLGSTKWTKLTNEQNGLPNPKQKNKTKSKSSQIPLTQVANRVLGMRMGMQCF
jgi:hypothetical protein